MLLSNKLSLDLIHRRLDELSKSITALDESYAKKAALEADLIQLRCAEVKLIADDATSPAALVCHRAKSDLQTAKVYRAQQAVLLSEEAVVTAANTAGQPIYMFKCAAVEAYFLDFESVCGRFFDRQDLPHLRNFAARHENGRALIHAEEFSFSPNNRSQRVHDLSVAGRLALAFADVQKAAAGLDVQIDVPDQWVD
jgi:hypothetical protein